MILIGSPKKSSANQPKILMVEPNFGNYFHINFNLAKSLSEAKLEAHSRATSERAFFKPSYFKKIMPKIINKKTGQEIEVAEGENIKDACEKLGVPFGCQNGMCGTCMIKIESGEDNLSELTEEEEILERDIKNRLACQCKLKKGDVEFSFE